MFLEDSSKAIRRAKISGHLGFTLLELLIVITILAVFVGISIPSYNYLVRKAEATKCMQRMKGIWTGMNAYMADHKQWPQRPEGMAGSEEKLWKWWYETLEPYDVSKELWLCPTEAKDLALTGRDEDEYTSSYVPANFDGREFTPFRWDQPWLLERADFHGQGNNILMSDGTVKKAPFSTTYEPN